MPSTWPNASRRCGPPSRCTQRRGPRLPQGGEAQLEAELEAIGSLVGRDAVVAVGETGLDYYRTREPEGRAAQERSFRRHIGWAHQHGRTLMIHDRDAHDDILRVVDDAGVPERMVMHCFSGDADFAARCLERGRGCRSRGRHVRIGRSPP
nr:TatD family hydrolase [Tessaracoccus coleopterorum]